MKFKTAIWGFFVAANAVNSLSFAGPNLGQAAVQAVLGQSSGAGAGQGRDCNPGTQEANPYTEFNKGQFNKPEDKCAGQSWVECLKKQWKQ